MKQALTRKQKEILDFYTNFISKNKRSPSYSEAGELLQLDRTVVFQHIKNLERKGYLIADRGDIRINHENGNTTIPLLGSIACGSPISVNEEVSEYIDIPKSSITPGFSFYALRAKGQSMEKAGINNGDILVIRQQTDVDNGDIGVVIMGDYEDDERATLKRIYKTPNAMILRPENDNFPTQVVTGATQIRGKLIAVIRNY